MATAPQTIVLIHGMWMTPLSWEHWAERYRAQDHEVVAPAWPGVSDDPAELRRGQDGWEEVADFILGWTVEHSNQPSGALA